MVTNIKKNRDTAESKELEIKIKLSHADICGNKNGALNGCNTNNSDESDNTDLEAYNGFAGILSIVNIIIIEPI